MRPSPVTLCLLVLALGVRVSSASAGSAGRPSALVVLMENGGFTNGMPADAAVGVPLCGRLELPSGSRLSELLSSLADGLATSASCVKPANWKTVSLPVTKYVALITNRVIEDVGVSAIRGRATSRYARIVILQDADVTIENIRTTLAELAPRYDVDMHVLAHGGPDSVTFRHRALRPRDIRSLADIADLHLRSVYQQNCYGSSLIDDWLAAGAGTVNGSDGINYMPLSYLAFLKRWAGGESFSVAVSGSSADWQPYFRSVYRYVDLYNGRKARTPAEVDIRGRLDPSDELRESRMTVAGSGTTTL